MRIFLLLLTILLAGLASAGDFVVRLRDGADLQGLAENYGFTILDDCAPAPFALVNLPDVRESELILALAAEPTVQWVERNHGTALPKNAVAPTMSRSGGGTVPVVWSVAEANSQNEASLEAIGWTPELANRGDRRVRIAVLDTGLSRFAPLWNRVVASRNFIRPDMRATDGGNEIDDDEDGRIDGGRGHGSMVTGLVASLAPKSDLIIARVANDEGQSTSWTLIRGVIFSVMNRADIINMSVGTPDSLTALGQIIDWARENGALVIAPVGNDDDDYILDPAALPSVMSVAGINPDRTKASFSNYGDETDFAAPAVALSSLWWDGKTRVFSGTSFAAPIAAAVIAIGTQQAWDITPALVAQVMHERGLRMSLFNETRYHGRLGRGIHLGQLLSDARIQPVPELSVEVLDPVVSGQPFRVRINLAEVTLANLPVALHSPTPGFLISEWARIPATRSSIDVVATAPVVDEDTDATLVVDGGRGSRIEVEIHVEAAD